MNELKEIFDRHRYDFLEKSNVVSVGLGYKVTERLKTEDLAIICGVTKKLPPQQVAREDLIPHVIDDRPTDVIETGIIRAWKERTDRWRPAPGAVSIGHWDITAGTLGCLVEKDGKLYILSNNHVLAKSNTAEIGDQILQPGPADGGVLTQDMIARLSEFVPIKFILDEDGCKIGNAFTSSMNVLLRATRRKTKLIVGQQEVPENRVDAAIALPINPNDVKNEILGLGVIQGWKDVGLETPIQKDGRTTAVTKGTVEQVHVTAQVQYGAGKVALFVDQFMAGEMSAGGDSGSAVLDEEMNLVGLLFAGSDKTTVINPIKFVFEELKLDSL